MPLKPAEQLAYSTVRLECQTTSGDTITGTAFFLALLHVGTSSVPVIITNKHVIKDAAVGTFHMTVADADGPGDVHIPIKIPYFESYWHLHPDPAIDLAAMPIGPILTQASKKGTRYFIKPLPTSLIADASFLQALSPAEEILMIGYPNGIWDSFNNYPIFRRGITATHPGKMYNGKPEFMIDAACFPGSSGSPVFMYNTHGINQTGRSIQFGVQRIKLLGVLYSGPQHMVPGEVKIVTIATIPVAFSSIPNNLGCVIRAEKLLDFEPLFKKLIPQAVP